VAKTRGAGTLICVQHRRLVLLPALAAALFLAGCGDTHVTAGDAAARDGITVTAVGEAKATPDTLRASLTASGSGATSEAALEQANQAAEAVRKALDDADVPEKDYSTPGLYVNPEYNYTQQGQELIGYRATQAFDIVFRDIENAGGVIDAIIAKSGNGVSVNGTSLEVSDTGVAAEAARKDAVAKAKAKAESYADLLGVDLGEVIYVQETSAPSGAVFDGRVAAAPKEAGTEIDPGTQNITVAVEIRWSLRD